MKLGLAGIGIASLLIVPAQAGSDDVASRPFTVHLLPHAGPPSAAAVGRSFTMQYLSSGGPPPTLESVGRVFTTQFLPQDVAPAVAQGFSRTLTAQFVPARLPPPADVTVARAFTVQILGEPLDAGRGPRDDGAVQTAIHTRPNPFRDVAVIRYSLARPTPTRLEILDVAGRSVRELIREERPAGDHVVRWDGTDAEGQPLSPGVYLCRLRAGAFDRTLRVVLLGK